MIGAFGFLSEYNLLSSTYKLKDILNDTLNENYPFVAINDTNNLYSSYKLFKHAKTPYIIGMKLNITHLNHNCSILVYATDNKGYQNLNILSSTVQLNENKRLEFEDILTYQKGLYFISSAHESDINKTISNNNLDETEKIIKDYKEKLEFFSIGLSLQSIEEEVIVAPKLKTFSDKYDLLLLPVNYIAHKKEDKEIYELIKKVQNENNLNNDIDFSFQSLKELKQRYIDYPEVFKNLKKSIRYLSLNMLNHIIVYQN